MSEDNPFPPEDPLHEAWERERPVAQREMHLGQLRFAERLTASYGKSLRYAHPLGWHRWDGKRWAPDQDGHARRCVIELLKDALGSLGALEEYDRKQLIRDIRSNESAGGIEGILRIASWIRPIALHATELDRDPWLFNCENGTLDLHTATLKPHDPDDLITRVAGCGYQPGVTGRVFAKFITEILPDEEVRAYVQRLFGQALFGAIRDHVLPIFTGTGGNGKTTLVELVREAFGGYAIEAEPELLLETNYSHPTGLLDLHGMRLAIIEEQDEGRRLAAATMKRITGGANIRARRMRQDFVEFTPTHTIVMIANRLPSVRGDDPAVWRRIQVVPFDMKFEPPDKGLPERLALEKPAVLAWLVDGYTSWSERGLDPPEAVQVSTRDYRSDSDTLIRFIEIALHKTGSAGSTRASVMWSTYRKWCEANGERAGSEKDFAKGMRSHGFESVKRKDGMRYEGLTLRTDDEFAGEEPWPADPSNPQP